MGTSTVSVIVPTLGDSLLVDALNSIRAQSYEPIEVVVVDGSPNGIRGDLRDRVDIYEYQEPQGLSAARNRGIELATGDYVAFLDEDDLFVRDSITPRVDELESGADIVYGNWTEVGPSFSLGDQIQPSDIHSTPDVGKQEVQYIRHFIEQDLRPSAVIVRRECFDSHQFDVDRKIAEDFHLFVRLIHDFRVEKVDASVLYYRVRDGTLSRSDRDAYIVEKLAAVYDLAARYPDLRDHVDLVVAREWRLHGRAKLDSENLRTSLHSTAKSLVTNPQYETVALWATLCLPLRVESKQRIVQGLEAARDRLRQLLP